MSLRREWLFVCAFGAIVMALTSVPYVVGALRSNDSWRFSGFVVAVEDGNSYLADMQQGAHGQWLFQNPYAPEPHTPALVYLAFILLGKLIGWAAGTQDVLRLHTALVIGFHAARLVCGFAMIAAMYWFLAELLPRVRQRRLALVIATLGGGLGWALLAVPGVGQPLEFYSPETFGFLHLYSLPHLAAARALMLGGFVCYLRAVRGHWALAFASGGLWLGLTLIQPLYMVIVLAALAFHNIVLMAAALRRLDHERTDEIDAGALALRGLRAAAIAGAFGLPMVVYTFLLFSIDPVYRAWGSQNRIFSPAAWHYASAYGLLLLFGAFGLRSLLRRNWLAGALVIGWLAALPLLVYAPYNLQRRLAEGAFVPLAALGVLGLTLGLRRVRLRPLRRAGPLLLLTLTLPGTLLLWVGGLVTATRYAGPAFQTRDQVAAYVFLGRSLPPRSVVLSSYEFGNAVPAYGYLVAYIGHGPETPELDYKRSVVARIYDGNLDEQDRRDLYFGEGAPYLVLGPHERALGSFDPATQADYLQPIFTSGDYAVWSLK